ncbi:hypothetical protein V6N11_054738 [Hibiscus sabdariffa]|uniref:Gag/pol protein n=1 Tax=Hibiscus sabdariffa TaxID=183260 RepID=A0ABR2S502_9ROSI
MIAIKFCACLNESTVSLKSSKQNTVTDSTIQAEYIAASEAAKEVVWIKKFISELRVISSISDVVELRCNDNGAIAQTKNPDLIEDPDTFLSASISYDEMWEYERYTRMTTLLIP